MTGVPEGCLLSAREFSALLGVAEGLTYKQIALRTGRSASTIRQALSDACRQLNVSGSIQAVIAAIRAGWITIDGRVSPDVPLKPVARAPSRPGTGAA